jgi:RNA polymerase sigma-70 factor (ECF subfamily)
MLTPWVHAIARYKLIDHLRSNKMSRMDVPIDDHQELMARDDHASTEGTHDMTKLLGRLPRKTRQAIEAVKLEGKSVTETAARYGMSESNVKISIHRGLKALASLSADDGDESSRSRVDGRFCNCPILRFHLAVIK